jgi:hypothetical protein
MKWSPPKCLCGTIDSLNVRQKGGGLKKKSVLRQCGRKKTMGIGWMALTRVHETQIREKGRER